MVEQIKHIKNWEELKILVNNTNPFKETIVLVGYINCFNEDKLDISELVFAIKPISVNKGRKHVRMGKHTKKNK